MAGSARRLAFLAWIAAPLAVAVLTAGQGSKPAGASLQDLVGAVKANDASRVAELLRQGADPNGMDANGMTPLHFASYRGGMTVALRLVAEGADVHARDSLGLRPLHAAAFSGRANVARLLIALGASVNARDNAGMTPLHCAAANGNREVAEILLGAGADLQALSNGGLTPAETASLGGHVALAKLLSTSGAAPVSPSPEMSKAHVYTNDDLAEVRSRNRLANEEQLASGRAPKEAPVPSVPGTTAKEPQGKEGILTVSGGAFRRAFEQGAWNEDIEGAVKFAKEIHKPLLALFTGSDWCAFCKRLEVRVLSTEMFRERVKGNYVLLYVDLPRTKSVPKEVLEQRRRFAARFEVRGYPTLVVLKDGDKYLDRISGFPSGTDAEKYISRIEEIAQ